MTSNGPSQPETPNDKLEERDLVMFDDPNFENNNNSELIQHLDLTDIAAEMSSRPGVDKSLVRDPSNSIYCSMGEFQQSVYTHQQKITNNIKVRTLTCTLLNLLRVDKNHPELYKQFRSLRNNRDEF